MTIWQRLPYIVPDSLDIFGFELRFYGLMYLFAFVTVYLLVMYRLRKENHPLTKEDVVSFIEAAFIGVLAGGRLGYVLFYNLSYYLEHPLEAVLPVSFQGGFHFTGYTGMSYHGGLIGVFIAAVIIVKKRNIRFWDLADLIAPAVPLGFTWGRIGNFLNGELYGRITQSAIGMYFPNDPTHALRHPSQLYEAFFEGLVLFAIIWPLRNIEYLKGRMAGLYVFGYGFFRFFVEFFRMPDEHLGFIFFRLSMGQLLCIGMMIAGAVLLYIGGRRRKA